jgi:hypothetical protein
MVDTRAGINGANAVINNPQIVKPVVPHRRKTFTLRKAIPIVVDYGVLKIDIICTNILEHAKMIQ